MAVGGWDGTHVIYEMIRKTGGKLIGGKLDADAAIAAAKGLSIQSPRGTITIDPATRDVVQDVYVRKVEKVGGKLYNVEFDKVPKVKDPGKS